MRIEIDTKEDLHNIHHIIKLLNSIAGRGSSGYDDNLFSSSSSSQSTPPPTPEASASLFNMFDSPSSSSNLPQTPSTFPSIFDEKKEEDKKDFLDSLQVY